MTAAPINTITATNEALTMSSREIAELLDSRHADVKRTIERLMERGAIGGYAPVAYTHEQNGQQYDEYHVGKRDSYVIVAQLSPEFTAALVDRWQELEAAKAPAIPQTFSQALLLAAKLEEERATLALENSKKDAVIAKKDVVIAEQAPRLTSTTVWWLPPRSTPPPK